MIQRTIEKQIISNLGKTKAIIILGARQVGKTTLVQKIAKKYDQSVLYLNADEPDIRENLTNVTSSQLKKLIGSNKLVIIDEAQRVENIGLTIKLIIDNITGIDVIATGSSSFELSNRISEPLTGRKIEFNLFPVSTSEMITHSSLIEEQRQLEHRLLYGFYPEVVNRSGYEQEVLREIAGSYLYKDIFALEKIKKPSLLEKLLSALALQIGNQVSFNELGQIIGADNQTIEKYVDLLEKTFIIFRLSSFSRNLRNELKKSRKIYFYDLGIRNAVIKNYSPLSLRQDVGALWENYIIAERLKYNLYNRRWVNQYFWRTRTQQEIDYIEESSGMLNAFEMKWKNHKKLKSPLSFKKAYPGSTFEIITRDNYIDFIS